jgi:hypothetical protein
MIRLVIHVDCKKEEINYIQMFIGKSEGNILKLTCNMEVIIKTAIRNRS